jgi:predicted ATPase/class 3 adenylate cyclase
VDARETQAITGTVTFLLTDVEGSARLWDLDQEAASRAIRLHEEILERQIRALGGRILKEKGEGDSLFCVFERASEAVRAALAAQRELARADWPNGEPLRVRIALHTGEAEERNGDYFGPVVNRCARIRGIGHGGQILLSQTTAVLAASSLPPGSELADLGTHRLRDLSAAEHIYEVRDGDSEGPFPPLRSLDAQPHNLPVQLTSFVGRKEEVAQALRLLRESRLLTLVGPGGCGKTRLALQTAAEAVELFPDGIWFVDLAPLADAELVADRVAAELRIRPQTGEAVEEAIRRALEGTKALLLLDNCEHLLPGMEGWAAGLLRALPHLKILATSRQPLGIPGEQLCAVQPMELPPSGPGGAELAGPSSDAERLFFERARAVQPGFQLSGKNAAAVAAICQALEGMPLAIELAAARLKALTPEQIAARLGDRFGLLKSGGSAKRDRHTTLRATVDWSYEMLSPQERALLASLSVFQGGWTLEAAEAVCAESAAERKKLLDLLQSLIDRSMVGMSAPPAGEARYRMLETIRQYAAEKAGPKRLAELRRRHFRYFAAFAEEMSGKLSGPEQGACLDRMDADFANLALAMDWVLSQPKKGKETLRAACSLAQFCFIRGHFVEAIAWLEEGLRRGGDAEEKLQADARNRLGIISMMRGNLEVALAQLEQSLVLRRKLRDRRGEAAVLNNIAMVRRELKSPEEAIEAFEVAARALREDGTPSALAHCLLNLGCMRFETGSVEESRGVLEESLDILRELGDDSAICFALANLGAVAAEQGRRHEAAEHFAEALTAGGRSNCLPGLYEAFMGATELLLDAGEDEAAARSFASANALIEQLGVVATPLQKSRSERLGGQLAGRPGITGHVGAPAAGFSTEQAIRDVGCALRAAPA